MAKYNDAVPESGYSSTVRRILINGYGSTAAEVLENGYELTNAYAQVGDVIETIGFGKLGLWVDADVNNSEGASLKLVGKQTSSGNDFELA